LHKQCWRKLQFAKFPFGAAGKMADDYKPLSRALAKNSCFTKRFREKRHHWYKSKTISGTPTAKEESKKDKAAKID